MRFLSVFSFLATVLALACGPAGAATVRQHDIDVLLTPQKQELSGQDTLTLDDATEPEVILNLARNAQVQAVSIEGRKLPHSFNQGLLTVTLPKAQPPSFRLTVEYRVKFDKAPPENALSADDPSYGVVGSLTEAGVFLLPDAGWYPRLPGTVPSYKLTVTAPKGVLAVSEGRLLGHELKRGKSVSRYEVTHPLDGLSLVAGQFTVKETKAGDIPVYTYFLPENEGLADSYLEASAQYIRFYSDLLGPYPFEKFAVVENFFPTGYGFASYTLLGSKVIRLPFIIKTSLGHEIVHSWFGNGVLVDFDQGNWSEGLTSYLADYLLRERESAEEAKEYRLQVLRNYAALVPEDKDFPLSEFKGRMSPESQAVGYGKATMVFHMARRMIGDEAFFASLRALVRDNLFKRASWSDIAKTMGREAGRDMEPFFRQWVDKPGAPKVSLDNVTLNPVSGGGPVLA